MPLQRRPRDIQPPSRTTHPLLVLFVGAGVISFSPVFVKLAAQEGLGTTAIAFWRTALGGLFLAGVALARGKTWHLPKQALFFAILAGAAFCADLFVWHRSIVYAGAGMSTILGNTQIFASAVLGFFVFKERLTWPFILAAIVAFLGVALLVGIGSEAVVLTGTYARGVIYGLITGIAYAHYMVFLKKGQLVAPKPDPIVFVAWASVFSAVFLGIVGWIEGSPFVPHSGREIAALAGLALLVQGLGWMAISGVLPRIVTARAGLVLLLQPILAMVWGTLLFAEHLSRLQILGACITLVAMYVGITQRGQATSLAPSSSRGTSA
jgi:drug/metabolite transporter (DMT)-like permease